jgi:peptidoglycan/xylan/chitin deacetylase (PgdA/CDA1 family)
MAIKNRTILPLILIISLFVLGIGYFVLKVYLPKSQSKQSVYTAVNQKGLNFLDSSKFLSSSTKGMMILIEFDEDTTGLSNFVNMASKRDIPTVLLIGPEFIKNHCEELKTLQDFGMDIGAGVNSKPFWDVPYQEQFDLMEETKQIYKNCFGEDLKMFNSRYFGYDENTLKAAESLGIKYIFARGTTGERCTVYKPKEYDVKLISVSNINSPKFGTGSLCDYSYWARAGKPGDFEEKLFESLKYDKISPVSHTYLGGMKKEWNNVYLRFFDDTNIEWESLDEFAKEPDLIIPFSKISQNREVQYVQPKPMKSLEETENVDNPCQVEELIEKPAEGSTQKDINSDLYSEYKVIMFHNNQGSMCLEAKEFFEEHDIRVKEVLTTDYDFTEQLSKYRKDRPISRGVSGSYGFYPFIFTKEVSYSGFNEDIEKELLQMVR